MISGGYEVPAYDDLPTIGDTGEHHDWGVFGDSDEIGTVNFITLECVTAAMGLVREGRVIDLSLPLDVPDPPLSAGRKRYGHTIERRRGGRDDSLDAFYLQGSTQWDGLQHIRYREFGYYNGRDEEDLDGGALGIDRLAARGIVGRGVLVDYAGFISASGQKVAADRRHGITPGELDEVLSWEGCSLATGDVILLRTGWLGWYLALDAEGRAALGGALHGGEGGLDCPGLDPAAATAAWLWNHRVAAVVADNPTVEALRVEGSSFLHRRLIPLLGMPLGEFWNLEALSSTCQELGRYEFLFVSVPLKLPRGVGSPGNGIAVL